MSRPLVSVIMPVRNEARFIALSLSGVLHQDYPADRMEILVADGQSDDDTLEIIQSLPGAERVRIVPNPRRVQAAGLNEALRVARGEIIVRVDGHTLIAPDYVRQCVDALAATGAQNVGGAMVPVGVSETGKAIAAATRSAFAVPTPFHTGRTGRFTDTVYLGAWPRAVFERLGGFDEPMTPNEDYELNHRIRAGGGRIYLAPAIRSQYYGRQSLAALARQYYHYGLGKTRTLRKAPASLRPRQLVAPLFVLALAAGPLLMLAAHTLGLALWLAVLGSYLAANLAVSAGIARRSGGWMLWRLPLVFATIHVLWGLGFWAGWLPGRRRASAVPAIPSLAAIEAAGAAPASVAVPASRAS